MAKRKDKPASVDAPAVSSRHEERRASAPKQAKDNAHKESFLGMIRGWIDALMLAFLLAMFIRTFVFELFMIPTGSMTPTLIGDDARVVAEYDWDKDGQEDIIAIDHPQFVRRVQVHLRNEDGIFDRMLYLRGYDVEARRVFSDQALKGRGRRDMIMVNKFAYWFSPPKRGDIAVFKTPDRPEVGSPFDVTKPVYIKRCIGLPGEEVTLQPVRDYTVRMATEPGRITPPSYGGTEYVVNPRPVLINGEPLVGDLFDRIAHFPLQTDTGGVPSPTMEAVTYPLGDDEVLMLGDNQTNSSDSRAWGGVPVNHVRGKAILRYMPLRHFGLLTPDK